MSGLRIVLLEDNANDAELIQELLQADHLCCEIVRVQSRVDFEAALRTVGIDLILADYKLPAFDGLSALEFTLRERPEVPFVLVSGTLGEELAVEALKSGATDFVLKTRLSRLVPAVRRALREASERAERKSVEQALRRSEMYLAEAQRLSHTGSFGWNLSSGEIYWSDETYRIFELDAAIKPTVQAIIDRTHPDDRVRLQRIIDRAASERIVFAAEHRLLMADGSIKHVRTVAHGVSGRDPDRFRFVGAVMDITERKRTEQTLLERESKIRRLVDANIIGIIVWNFDGEILEANDAFLRMVGYEREDIGSGRVGWRDLTPQEWLPRSERALAEAGQTGRAQPYEKEYIRRDGSRVPVLVGLATFDASGTEGVAFVVDLTERKRAETEAHESDRRYQEVQRELAHANRVATMGQLTASIAHEVNQPIAATVTNAQAALRWLAGQPPEVEKARQALGRIVDDGNRAGNVIGRIHELIRKTPPRKEPVDINEAIREVIELTRGEVWKHGASVQTHLADRLPLVEGDRVQLQQVLLNLLINAMEVMSGVSDGVRELRISTARADSGCVLVTVLDSGPGFAADSAERLFAPFYTTKSTGLGMGLPICRSIVEAHGGRLWASANVPRGAIFQFTVPAHPDASS
ncbi:PAS domain S-box protein [Paraburkholderia sp. UCT31]|uniref:PAS domain S-box protein n=1 Tax=Paraburkholderia sp. UCT31 TaxID=2615209 RepID=UPI001655096C|nr:hybrid sensor histidine kinase/response regulator [Paraburkholderia sp. UCT31]MBC8738218.1 PAS domain S-box protein [Paraburkholderia sp. UCT31]